MAFQKLDQRLAAVLIAKPKPIRATHQAFADELGSLREIVSQLLKNFAEQGWMRLGREPSTSWTKTASKNSSSFACRPV